jgi:hypothetical protein
MFTAGRVAGTQRGKGSKRIEEESVASEERLRELEEKYEDYKVYDNQGSKIGKVDDLFVDETDHEEYIGVKLGLLGRKSTLIPMEILRVNESDRTIEVSESKDHVNDAPSFDDDEDITADYERRIRDHFGLESVESSSSRGSYGGYSEGDTAASGASADAAAEEHDDSGDYESQGSTTDTGYSSESAEHEERAASTTGSGGSQSVPEYQGQSSDSAETTDAGDQEGSTGIGASGGNAGYSETGSSEETTRQVPTSRQTEETETFQEGGRTKVRRRIVREEIIDEDPNA